MAQLNPLKFQMITCLTGVLNNSTWSVLTVPLSMPSCRNIVIKNVDASNAISVCTDTSDPNPDTIPSNSGSNVPYFSVTPQGAPEGIFNFYGPGEAVCYLKGAGAAPMVYFYA